MSDIISNDAAHPEWRQLCQAALLETNTAKLLERIARARNAVLDRIEDCYSKPPTSEQAALRDALATLDNLRRITERPSREFKVSVRYSWQESFHAALLETDWTKMVELVQAAESEIHKRRLELSEDHNGTQEEREAVVNALNGLRVLRMDAVAWRKRQNLK